MSTTSLLRPALAITALAALVLAACGGTVTGSGAEPDDAGASGGAGGAGGAAGIGGSGGATQGCQRGGSWYPVGASFPAGDGCNTCTCTPDGTSSCTMMWCSTCVYAGQQYEPGDSFPALDGCNTCECSNQGISCTEIACPCDPAKEWWRNYVAHSPDECAVIDYVCPTNTIGFSNACGCGCEQDESCPPYINCMPPAPNCESDHARCPFSPEAM